MKHAWKVLPLLFLPRFSAAAPDPAGGDLYALVPDGGIYLGWMPAAYVNAGEKFTADLARYMDIDGGARVSAPEGPGGLSAAVKLDGRFIELAVPGDSAGLYDLPLAVKTAAGERKVFLTFIVGRRPRHAFTYRPGKEIKKASVAGGFNGWSDSASPMSDDDKDGVWTATVSMDPGTHSYKFVVDGEWLHDPGNPRISEDQFKNSLLTVEGGGTGKRPYLVPEKRSAEEVVFRAVSPSGKGPFSWVSALIQTPDGGNKQARFRTEKDLLRVDVKGEAAGSYLRVAVMDGAGGVSAPLRVPLGPDKSFRWHDAVIYFAMLDRFSNGDPANDAPTKDPNILPSGEYHGGDLAGLLKKIEEGYFDRLGVNALWLSPVYRNPDKAFREYLEPYRWFSGYHGYWPTDLGSVDPRLGDMALLKRTVAAAHARGIRVLFDMVFNHTHMDHPWWKEHPDWFIPLKMADGKENLRLWNEQPFTTWFDRFIPTFDLEKPELVRALLANAQWWLEETGADGFRLDAVKHVRHHFWGNLRKHLRRAVEKKRGERLYMVGETFLSREGIMEFVGPNRLDGQFDFPLYDALVPAFTGKGDFRDLDAALEAGERIYGKETVPSTLIGNQDKARFMAFADGDLPAAEYPDDRELGYAKPPKVDDPLSYARLKSALTFIFTIDGAPLLYYGDEFGLTGAGDPDNRRDMRFGGDLSAAEKGTLAYTELLGKIRAAHPALRYGSRRTVLLEKDLYAYARAWFGDAALVVFNSSAQERRIKVHVSPDLPPGRYDDLLGKQSAEVGADGMMELAVPPLSAAVFARR